MLTNHARMRFSVVFASVLMAFFTTTAIGQNASQTSDTLKKLLSVQVTAWGETASKPVATATPDTVATVKFPVAASTPELVTSGAKPVAEPTPGKGDLEDEIAAMKAENAAVREQLRRMEEGQKILIEQLDRMRRKMDRADASASGTPALTMADVAGTPANASSGDAEVVTDPTDTATQAASVKKKQGLPERYQEGIVIWKTPDEAKVPFMLRFNIVTQFRYLNTLDSDPTFTDHLGVERDVQRRNDVTVNRSMFTFSGYIWDKRLQYSLLVWTAAGAASIIVAGSIGWRFNRHVTLTAGYLGIPGSRSLTNTFPYFTSTDRTLADNFFRPGFTQGVMASGEITKGLYYNAFLGNSLNTLSISANKIDTNLMGAGSVWWEPLGGYSEPGRSVNMYDDYFAQKKVRIRLGSSFTISREDRFSNLDTSTPENTGVYNSDGVNAFQTGAFALGVTVRNATYKMWATDWGFKYNGLAINGQYYARWLNDFDADGPLPLTSTFDHGFEMSVGHFVIPKKVMIYGRGSAIFGQFKNPNEFGAGVKWHFLPTERLWLNFELMKVKGSAYNGAFSPYNSGMNGWVPMIQSVIAF